MLHIVSENEKDAYRTRLECISSRTCQRKRLRVRYLGYKLQNVSKLVTTFENDSTTMVALRNLPSDWDKSESSVEHL